MRKCKVCKTKYEPRTSLQVVCGYRCALTYSKDKAEKQAKKELREAKAKLKPKSRWMAEAQAAFNRYIRERDSHLTCVSCGRFHQGQWHAGHYRTVGANPELRFCEVNCWRQCAPCNNHKSGDIVNYRIHLKKRIGKEKLDWLEGPHAPKKYTIEDLKDIKSKYQRKYKDIAE